MKKTYQFEYKEITRCGDCPCMIANEYYGLYCRLNKRDVGWDGYTKSPPADCPLKEVEK